MSDPLVMALANMIRGVEAREAAARRAATIERKEERDARPTSDDRQRRAA